MNYDNLLPYAKLSLEHGLLHGAPSFLNPTTISSEHSEKIASFVSLTINNQNIGCRGDIYPIKPLYKSVMDSAFLAGFRDSRFPMINSYRLNRCNVEISILKDRKTFTGVSIDHVASIIGPNDTLLLEYGSLSAIMLNHMQSSFTTIEEFINATVYKSNLQIYPFKQLNVSLIDTMHSSNIPFKDIKCYPNTDS